MKNKNHIIESVQKQLFRYGIKSLNMDDIAYQLGISKKTLYQVVGNKESMVELTTENFVAEQQTVIEGICQQSKDNIRELIALTLHISEVSGQFSDSMIYDLKKYYPKSWEQLSSFYYGFLFGKIHTNIERGVKAGEYRASLQLEFTAKLYLASLTSVLEKEYPFGSSQDVLDLFLDLHLKGMTSTKGSKIYEKHLGGKSFPGQLLT